ncbi:MAG: hypothetical protein LKM39_08015 [Chiayiivirga sp.]|nr:hypothetical protein [Chiayiivirga sp.]
MLDISANAVTGRIRVAWDPARTPLAAVRGWQSLGYRPVGRAAARAGTRAPRANATAGLLRLGIAGSAACRR